ncbi:MAG: 3-deoxy-7-phosphoheptulonate synthase [Deltaproteobacteria bacterium]|nr:3-deoxy-7-phosphoheptulonate synthase [Deltaproteobacteria bacterium]
MIIVLKQGIRDKELKKIVKTIKDLGYTPHVSKGVEQTIIGAVGSSKNDDALKILEFYEGVEAVMAVSKPYKLASRDLKPHDTVVRVKGGEVGGKHLAIIAGPCSIENEDQMMATAKAVKAAGATFLRGGAFKPRTSPYAFQGLGVEGLKLLKKAGQAVKLPTVTEIMDPQDLEVVEDYADVLQIGARNCQNFSLLKEVGRSKKPVFLKRGMSVTIEEFLMSAEYILAGGNKNVILCERGIRTFETATRNTLDLSAIPVLKERTHLPVVVDPSHATGVWRYVIPMARAAVAAGADGVMVEVHPHPDKAYSDGPQQLKFHDFGQMVGELRGYAKLAGKPLA